MTIIMMCLGVLDRVANLSSLFFFFFPGIISLGTSVILLYMMCLFCVIDIPMLSVLLFFLCLCSNRHSSLYIFVLPDCGQGALFLMRIV